MNARAQDQNSNTCNGGGEGEDRARAPPDDAPRAPADGRGDRAGWYYQPELITNLVISSGAAAQYDGRF